MWCYLLLAEISLFATSRPATSLSPAFARRVACFANPRRQVGLQTPLEELAHWFDRDHFALVCTEQRSYTGGTYSTVTVITGVVTRVDLLSFIATRGGESPVSNARTLQETAGSDRS